MLDVVCVGAGPVGCLLALLLQTKHSCRVRVYEKRADLRLGSADVGRSINLILTSRGLHALTQVGLREKALGITVPVEERAVHLQETPDQVNHQPYGINKSEVNHSVSRTGINALLIQAAEEAGVKFFFEHSVERVDLIPEEFNTSKAGRILVIDHRDTKNQKVLNVTDANFIFGTDGAGSAVRTGIYNGHVFNGEKSTQLYMQRLGVAYKEVQFKTTAEGKYPLKPSGLHIWPRGAEFLMALADLEPSLTGTLYVPDGSAPVPGSGNKRAENLADKLDRNPALFEKHLRKLYPDLPALVPDFMKQVRRAPFAFLATLRSSHWHYGPRAACVGDAAHAVVPFFGQGMNLGLETAWTLHLFLGRYLDTWSCNVNSKPARLAVTKRLEAFAEFQKPNAKAIADMAIYNYGEMASFVSQPWYQHRKKIETVLEKSFPHKMRSRYYMVTNTLIPYDLVMQAGEEISKCIKDVDRYMKQNGIQDPHQVPNKVLESAIDRFVTPFYQRHGIQIAEKTREYYTEAASKSLARGGGGLGSKL